MTASTTLGALIWAARRARLFERKRARKEAETLKHDAFLDRVDINNQHKRDLAVLAVEHETNIREAVEKTRREVPPVCACRRST